MRDLRTVMYKPYIKSTITLDVKELTTTLQTRVRTALRRGYIASQRGDSKIVFEAFAECAGLPVITTPTLGYLHKTLEIVWGNLPRPNELIDAVQELYKAEQIAAKLIHGHDSEAQNPARRNTPNSRYDIVPEQYMSFTRATWSFRNTTPKWTAVIDEVFNAVPWLETARKRAVSLFDTGQISFKYRNG